MNPLQIIFNQVSELTGGIVTDSTTLIMALITCGAICMAIDILSKPLLARWSDEKDYQRYKKNRLKAERYRDRFADEKEEG